MGARFLDALVHRGPGYETGADGSWTVPRASRVGRFLDALTHSGPGYALPSGREVLESRAAARGRRAFLEAALLEGFEKVFYAKGHLEASSAASDPGESAGQLTYARCCLREFLEHSHTVWPAALSGMEETVRPFDLLARAKLARLERVLWRLTAEGEQLLEALDSRSDARLDAGEEWGFANREVKSSLASLGHLAAR